MQKNNEKSESEGSEDISKRLKKAKLKRKYGKYTLPAVIASAIILAVLILLIVLLAKACSKKDKAADSGELNAKEVAIEEVTEAPETPEEIAAREHEEYVDSLLAQYNNIAVVTVSEDQFLNIREEPNALSHMMGKLYNGSVCDVLSDVEAEGDEGDGHDWKLITSGGIQGYVSGDYLITGDEAKELARDMVKTRAVITADELFVREEPNTDSYIVTTVSAGERYEIFDETEGWYKINNGYISSDYAEKEEGLSVAVKPSAKELVVNMYDNLGVSTASSYVNIRKSASTSAEIIGKFPGKAGAEILGEDGDFYHIKSGSIDGYVSKEYIVTGAEARQRAKENAELMAIVTTEDGTLNVRSGPGTEYDVWTTISNNERYVVLNQTSDGWVELELEDENNAFASADYLTVKYALAEAIHFSPTEEANMLRNQICDYALQFLGNSYVWGGTSLTNGCDCSGFTQSVMAHFGISLPRVSRDQANAGSKVTSDSMRPGDLIFYTNSSGTVNHVSMYIGNGQVVHAASKKSGIKISSWNYRSPKAIRNVIGN